MGATHQLVKFDNEFDGFHPSYMTMVLDINIFVIISNFGFRASGINTRNFRHDIANKL